MKSLNIKKVALAALAAFTLNTGSLFAGNNNSTTDDCSSETATIAAAPANAAKINCYVTNQQVIAYLNAHGYSRVTVLYWDGECSAMCDTSNPYNTIVFTDGFSITGSCDMPNKK